MRTASTKPPTVVRVLGLDPGSRLTGWGIVDCVGGRVVHVASGTLKAIQGEGGERFGARLHLIFTGIQTLCAEYQPHEVAVERVFVHKNPDSALKLGQARGAALCAAWAAAPGALAEYAPREVKQAIVGTGGADKLQVEAMVRRLLSIDGKLGADAADALAIALCHAHTRSSPAARAAALAAGSAVAPVAARRRSSRAAWTAALAGRVDGGGGR